MTLTEFFRRLLVHATLALALWFVAALALERLIPGFVTPFVNLPGFGLVLAVLGCVALAASSSDTSRIGRIVSLVLLGLLAACACLFLWTRVDGLGGLGLGLIIAAVVSVVLLCASFWSSDTSA